MTLPFKVSGRLSNLSKFSINFDNEEQYNNFIKSIKDEVVKEIEPEKRKKYPDNNWTVFRRELQKDVAERQNKEDRKNGKTSIASYSDYYPFLKEAFNTWGINFLSIRDIDKMRSFKNELFELIDKYREENK